MVRIDVDIFYFIGSVDVWCFDLFLYDFIFGNICGVRKLYELNLVWIYFVENIVVVEMCV